jgi:hypothetical protein
MRTTIDMQDTLLRAAKIRASERGETLKDLINRAIAHELGLSAAPRAKAGRVRLPLVGRGTEPKVLITNEDIADAFDAEDVARYSTS